MHLAAKASVLLTALSLSGCGANLWQPGETANEAALPEQPSDLVRPVARPDTSEPADVQGERASPGVLGPTIVSLGNPGEPGLWLKTPLVQGPRPGKVSFGGKSVDVELRPIEGQASAGSRLSLQAMQALGIPLTDLAEVTVSAI